MKNYLLIFATILSMQNINAQCVADAGSDQHRCNSSMSVQLGGAPTASFGTPPYSYTWSINPISFGAITLPNLYASNILDDTTSANPTLTYLNIEDSVKFYLKVTDALNCTSFDTCTITTSNFGIHLGQFVYNITRGDSVFLNQGANVFGGVGSTFLWSPTHGLSDSTLYSGFWAKPEYDIAYQVTVTDSNGCVTTGGAYYIINVFSVGVQETKKQTLKIYPNPTNDLAIIEGLDASHIHELSLFDVTGRRIMQTIGISQIDLSALPAGVYFLEVSQTNGTSKHKIVKR